MSVDSRDLLERVEELKQQVLDSFLETFEHYADQTETFKDILFEEEEIQSWKEGWLDEIEEITDIERLEDEISPYAGDSFEDGIFLIEDIDFQDYCEQFVEDCGYISRDMPSLIRNNINWEVIADDMRQDYTEVEFRGTNYLYR